MNDEQRVAIVTGANRGIGSEICCQLTQKGMMVILTSRDEEKGKLAVEQLSSEGFDVRYAKLDVTDEENITSFAKAMEDKYGRCDVLVNNAGIFPDSTNAGTGGWPSVFETSIETMRRGMETNVYGPMLLCQAFVPLMEKNNYGRIVNLSSGMGQLTHMNGGCPAYRLSKTSLNALTRTMAEDLEGTNILVNSMCPGWVKTEMGGPGATREVAKGAETAIFLATLPDDGPTGKFFRDRKEFEW